MAIKLDSTAWDNAEEDQIVRSKVLEFLRNNKGLAFHARELADEVMGTNWEKAHEQERIIQKKGEREFYANKEEYGFAGEELDTTMYQIETYYVINQLEDLVDQGVVETRNVDGELTNIPVDFELVDFYTYSGD